MKQLALLAVMALTLHFGMTKEEFNRANGFPGTCSKTTMPLLNCESCERGDSTYFYINNHLTGWETHDHVY